MPNPSLWSDILEKIRALGFNGVSFYIHHQLTEYAKDDFNFDGWRSIEPLFKAAKDLSMYVTVRPGPYINAETTGGGTPGWGARVPGAWRTENQTYLDAIEGYVRKVSQLIAPHQITNGGPVILVTPENEFSYCFESPNCPVPWPQPKYMQFLMDTMREEGIVVPFLTNELNSRSDNYAPGSGVGAVDMRAYDSYPLLFVCNDTSRWPDGSLPTDLWNLTRDIRPTNPHGILEMQGGAHGRWGWFDTDDCAEMTGPAFDRVFYRNYLSQGVKIWNLYMMYGGTNWGGIASPATITSYDYGAHIKENRLVTREKYSELKMLAQFLQASPTFSTMEPVNLIPESVNGSFTDNKDIAVTRMSDVAGSETSFWIVRHSKYNLREPASYKLKIPTSRGDFSIPQSGESLQLQPRDSRIHVSDYEIGNNISILYSSAEVLTWREIGSTSLLFLYGLAGEKHESAFVFPRNPKENSTKVLAGNPSLKSQTKDDTTTINYIIESGQAVVQVGDLKVVILDRRSALDIWTPTDAIISSPYLIRSAERNSRGVLAIRGDLNVSSANVEVWADEEPRHINFNGKKVKAQQTPSGTLSFKFETQPLKVKLPDLAKLSWKSIDNLPEVQQDYNDLNWPDADLTNSTNPRKLTTPTSLYSCDYGFHTGNIIWRGHFTATGTEGNFTAHVQGGGSFGASLYLDDKQLDYWAGEYNVADYNLTASLPQLQVGSEHVFTVLHDHMGIEQNYGPGGDLHKVPRGILDYGFSGTAPEIRWKLTGNLGGEHPVDKVRGPVNEGGLYIERQGLHQPGVNTNKWESTSPLEVQDSPGARYYTTTFDLKVPKGLDVPLDISFTNTTEPGAFRALVFVNGWQFGKYVSNLGPQTHFAIPSGIINLRGHNTLGISVWTMEAGAQIESLELSAAGIIETSMSEVKTMPQPKWKKREGAY